MPTVHQDIAENPYPNANDGTLGQSNSRTLQEAFPKAIHHNVNSPVEMFTGKDATTTTTIEGYTNENLRTFYRDFVMGDAVQLIADSDTPVLPVLAQIPGSSFPDGVSFNYIEAPATTALTPPDGENAPGQAGSTISSTGRGPNVATLNINSETDPSEGKPFVEAKPTLTPSADAPEPSAASSAIAAGNVYGGGVLGKSKHSS